MIPGIERREIRRAVVRERGEEDGVSHPPLGRCADTPTGPGCEMRADDSEARVAHGLPAAVVPATTVAAEATSNKARQRANDRTHQQRDPQPASLCCCAWSDPHPPHPNPIG
jgi:hypothetical protein